MFKRKYTPEQYIIRSGPRIQGTKPVEINGRTVNVPTISNTGIDRMSYIRFASATLPRVNPHRCLDQDTTNQAWNSHVSYIFENWQIKNAKAKPGGLQAQVPSFCTPPSPALGPRAMSPKLTMADPLPVKKPCRLPILD